MARHVYLVGFMGCGKSTVGSLLAEMLDRPFHDLDALIEKEQKMSISEIFALKGEAYFRLVESRLLEHTAQLPPSVIALGGGTFVTEANRALVKQNGTSVWLRLPLWLAWERCQGLTNRPLARQPEQFRDLFIFRQAHYMLAQIQVDVAGKRPHQIGSEIIEKLAALGC